MSTTEKAKWGRGTESKVKSCIEIILLIHLFHVIGCEWFIYYHHSSFHPSPQQNLTSLVGIVHQ